MPRQIAVIHDRALRGDIISADGYTLSTSSKTYMATIFTQSLNPDKISLLIKLVSIYTGADEVSMRKAIESHRGYIVLVKNLDANSASRLKLLAYKLRRMGVFVTSRTSSGMDVLYGLDIVESGEERSFLLQDTLSPVVGYVKKSDDGKYISVDGVKGIEKSYQKYLKSENHGFTMGKRDVTNSIILDKTSIRKYREDGMSIHLNVPLSLQKRVEKILDKMKLLTGADEIIAGVMESKSGKVLALASSQRYDPSHIKKEDTYKLNPKFSEFEYEPGSVIKPLTLSVALEYGRVTPDTWFDTKGGSLRIGKGHVITDDDVFDSQTATDIIVHSSNVGISKIAWRLSGTELYKGYKKFGLGEKSGLDLSRDLKGKIETAKRLKNKSIRANQSYGYSMMTTFAQLWKAYSAFNNDGVAVTPKIVDYLEDDGGKTYQTKEAKSVLYPLSKKNANSMKKILKKVVSVGTGKAAQYIGLEIGGKTGTAHIVEGGVYVKQYNSSFYGFANDDNGSKYTIGVLAMRLKDKKYHFASKSAVPVFRMILDSLVELGYLKPNLSKIEKIRLAKKYKKIHKQVAQKQRDRAYAIKIKLKQEREVAKRKQKLRSRHKEQRAREKPHVEPQNIKRRPTPREAVPDLF